MTHHKKSHRRRTRTRTAHRRKTRTRKHHKTSRRRYRTRGGGYAGGVDNYNPAGYTPVGTISPLVMVPPNYIPFNTDVSKIPYPLSTTNFPLP